MSTAEMSKDEQVVRERWPDAFAHRGVYQWQIHDSQRPNRDHLGYGATKAEAWADAAKRLEGGN